MCIIKIKQISPNGVFEASVSGSRIHQVCSSQLFDVSESLELRSVDDLYQQMRQLNLTMNGVIEDLQDRKQDNTCTDIDIAIQRFGNALGRGAWTISEHFWNSVSNTGITVFSFIHINTLTHPNKILKSNNNI